MSAKEIENWLKTEESQSVGMKDRGEEAVGHQSGRHIVELLRMQASDYSEDDYQQIRRVVGYIHRHSAQRPNKDVEHTPWRYSLKNWGHEPLKE